MTGPLHVEVDQQANLGYVSLSDREVASTVELGDSIMVDLDEFGVAVGIEVLDLAANIPLDEVSSRFHVRSEVLAPLRLLQARVGGLGSVATRSPGIAHVTRQHTVSTPA